jgi:uncharacterized protein
METTYTLNGISFAWDNQKATDNLRKHSISFEAACEAFFDPFVCYLGEETVAGENRETIIGITPKWQLLFVVYVMRKEVVRIISARLVTKIERKQYENR